MTRIVGFVGPSNSGKTWTIEATVAALTARGLKVGVLKHCPKGYEMDRPGKDSTRVFEAGAATVGVVGPAEYAVRYREAAGAEPLQVVARHFPADLDLVILEGFGDAPVPQVRVLTSEDAVPAASQDPRAIAWVHPIAAAPAGIPVFRPGDGESLGRFLAARWTAEIRPGARGERA